MLTIKKLAGDAPGMNPKEHTSHRHLPSVNKAAHSGFETREDITRSQKQRYQWPHKRPCIHQTFSLKNVLLCSCFCTVFRLMYLDMWRTRTDAMGLMLTGGLHSMRSQCWVDFPGKVIKQLYSHNRCVYKIRRIVVQKSIHMFNANIVQLNYEVWLDQI